MPKRIKIYFPDGENEMEIFDDQLDRALIIGSLMIVGAGLFALNRERRAKLSTARHR